MGTSSQPSFCLLTQGPPEILHEILSYCQQNDLCITCPLYKRLREWAGDLKYCTICSKFTKRETTNKYKGRCLHGRPKTRKAPNNHWTAKKGQSYGYRWWRRWGTSGVDSWAYNEKPRTPGQIINARVV
ncbi:unnamed protein product [Colletotrichum noveboracense]|uniref:F-box domain-containing protein n=1 Tax=Colletotrichum noveboracense TaxID=2664923 RepID=A0A9W4RLZ7_9PEZI|nr:unnamed protein product [Colletotrichum noveboracense]